MWTASEKYPPSAEKKQRQLVFGECEEPAESASDKAEVGKDAEDTEGTFGKALIMF